jgi:hypothetical protein
MKTKTFFYLILILLLIACTEDEEVKAKFESSGLITGLDLTLCGCCGGYIIEMDTKTYRCLPADLPETFREFLAGVDFSFPLQVRMTWSLKEYSCSDRITIHKIETISITHW